MRDWWLPPNYSTHGIAVDHLFNWILAVSIVVLVAVHVLLILFLLRYRRRTNRPKAHYTDGNARLEFFWTLIPTLILASLAVASTHTWNNFRYSPDLQNPNRSKVLVIGQQFKWHFIYPGPDGKFGRYLLFPKLTDPAWPIGPDGQLRNFQGVAGPALLPHDKAVAAINDFLETDESTRIGKDFSDPDGLDDDYQQALDRTLFVPVNRPIEIQVASRDVIHDFYLPNFRAQLYAVPGMIGRFSITATTTTRQLEATSRRTFSVSDLPALLADPAFSNLTIDIDSTTSNAVKDKFGWRFVRTANGKPATIIRDQAPLTAMACDQLLAAGITQIIAHKPAYFEIACAQLCGLGHYTMQGRMVVLDQDEFDRKFPSAHQP